MVSYFPNLLTIFRIISAPVLFYVLTFHSFRLACIIIVFAALTDFFDGYFARFLKAESSIGMMLDPIADKIFSFFLVFGLAFNHLISPFMVGLLLGRDVLILVGGYLLKKRHNNLVLAPLFVGKVYTALLLAWSAVLLLQWLILERVFCVSVFLTSLWSLLQYGKRFFKLY